MRRDVLTVSLGVMSKPRKAPHEFLPALHSTSWQTREINISRNQALAPMFECQGKSNFKPN